MNRKERNEPNENNYKNIQRVQMLTYPAGMTDNKCGINQSINQMLT
jgi:hypothetical protein